MKRRAAILYLLIGACASSPLPPGAVCQQTSDCESDLFCLDVAQSIGSGCAIVGKHCSKLCTADTDCASLGSDFKCFACGPADKSCAASGP